jgi:hypothetical protein
VPLALTGKGIGESDADWAVFAADQQIDMGHFVSIAGEGFTNKHRHACILLKSV